MPLTMQHHSCRRCLCGELGVLVRRVFTGLKPVALWVFSPSIFGALIISSTILFGSWKIADEMPSSYSPREICSDSKRGPDDICDAVNDLENAVRSGSAEVESIVSQVIFSVQDVESAVKRLD